MALGLTHPLIEISKGKVLLRTGHEGPEGEKDMYFYSSFNLGARLGRW
jgi:hypothetical protein